MELSEEKCQQNSPEQEFKPTRKMLLFVNKLLDMDNNSSKTKIAEDLDIDRKTVYLWYKNSDFIKWLNKQAENLFAESKTDRLRVALRKAKAGDYSFSKLIFEMTGEYTPTVKQDINIKVTEIIISHVVEVINKYVADEDIRKQISQELYNVRLN